MLPGFHRVRRCSTWEVAVDDDLCTSERYRESRVFGGRADFMSGLNINALWKGFNKAWQGGLRIAHTLRYLKGKQLLYLLRYRLLPTGLFRLRPLCPARNAPVRILSFPWQHLPVWTHCRDDHSVKIFGHTANFAEGAWDWRIGRYGKLWNYHLQYLDLLLDETLDPEYRRSILADCSRAWCRGTLLAEPYPVSQRIVNILVFHSVHGIQDPESERAFRSQVNYLMSHLEFHLMGNHLLENYIALSMGTMACGSDTSCRKWVQCLISELSEQLLVDGAHCERSLSYHTTLLGRLLCLLGALERQGVCLAEAAKLRSRCSAMLSWLYAMTDTLQYFPLFNDSVRWPKALLERLTALAAELDVRDAGLGLSASGYRKFKCKGAGLMVNIGEVQPAHQPGHSHADLLHFVLSVNGHPCIVDPGISTYEVGKRRLRERSTDMHNVVSIAGENQSELWSAFRMGRRARLLNAIEGPLRIEAEIRWYRGHRHHRSMELSEGELVIRDHFERSDHSDALAMAHFHLDAGLVHSAMLENEYTFTGGKLSFVFEGLLEKSEESYDQCFNFGDCRPAHRITAYFCNELITRIRWSL
ncbi:MAG: heparinase II/III-family protein [Saprospiraceae bacterium]|nr:heparinase II/III-family protein [Saprospiraceae bacterium]